MPEILDSPAPTGASRSTHPRQRLLERSTRSARPTHSKGIKVKSKKAVALCATLGLTLAGLAVAIPAQADVVSNSYVLVGSDTLQDSANALANGTGITGSSVRVTAAGNSIGSFDATGSAAIQTKSGGAYFSRPSGSGDGVTALLASINGTAYTNNNGTPAATVSGLIDIARSSSAPTQSNTGLVQYFPYGRDALSYAYKGGTGLGEISAANLKLLYSCDAATLSAFGNVTPVLPQATSGTRKFFLTAIGNPTVGSCVLQNEVIENDGSVLANNQLIPFSVASWVAQKSGAAQDRTSTATLGSAIPGTAPFAGTGSATVPNAAYYSNATFGRDTYVVVEFARVDPTNPKFDQALADLVDRTKPKSLTNFSVGSSTSGAVKTKFGFLAPSSTNAIRASK